jgi:hypothetical protein
MAASIDVASLGQDVLEGEMRKIQANETLNGSGSRVQRHLPVKVWLVSVAEALGHVVWRWRRA